MLSRRARWQVVIFLVISLVGVSYVGANYVGLHRVIWDSGYTVTARFSSGGGIFTNSEVTYRGVPVGRVGELRLTDSGMEIDLHLDPDSPPIPADTRAVVANRSAAGEQYVDLRPRRRGGAKLHEGSVIRQRDTRIPIQEETVLANLDELVASVPRPELRTVVGELYQATSGAGRNLEVLLDRGIEFIEESAKHVPEVTRLVTDSRTVLDTQRRLSAEISSFGRNAKLLAGELKESDRDLRRLLPAVPPAARQVSELLRESGPELGVLLTNLLSTAQIVEVRQDGLEQLLVNMPKAVAAGEQVLRSGKAHFGLSLTFFDPPPCTSGYGVTRYRDGLDSSAGTPLNLRARCTLPKGHETGVRGSRNSPTKGR